MDHSPLGTLPPELQDSILEYTIDALLPNGPIYLRDKGTLINLPIAQTSSELRKRSLRIFYEHNFFRAEVMDCDVRFLVEWLHQSARHYDFKGMSIGFSGRADWANAMQWLKLSHDDLGSSLNLKVLNADESERTPLFAIMARAVQLVDRLKEKGMSWLEMAEIVEDALWMSRGAVHWRNAPSE